MDKETPEITRTPEITQIELTQDLLNEIAKYISLKYDFNIIKVKKNYVTICTTELINEIQLNIQICYKNDKINMDDLINMISYNIDTILKDKQKIIMINQCANKLNIHISYVLYESIRNQLDYSIQFKYENMIFTMNMETIDDMSNLITVFNRGIYIYEYLLQFIKLYITDVYYTQHPLQLEINTKDCKAINGCGSLDPHTLSVESPFVNTKVKKDKITIYIPSDKKDLHEILKHYMSLINLRLQIHETVF